MCTGSMTRGCSHALTRRWRLSWHVARGVERKNPWSIRGSTVVNAYSHVKRQSCLGLRVLNFGGLHGSRLRDAVCMRFLPEVIVHRIPT